MRSRVVRSFVVAASALVGTASCGGQAPPPKPPPPAAASAAAPPAAPPPDVLGPRPEPGLPAAFLPPAPVVFTATNGMTVWLLERHGAPVVACDITVPSGAASDPPGKGGVAYATAAMLDEGAGKRGAIDLARAIDDLGANLGTTANADSSTVSLSVLTRHLHEAFAIFGDVVARPRLEAGEYKRVKELWASELLERSKDPDATARVVFRAALFGPDHPYAHPWDGTPKSARAVGLDDVRRFYRAAWRPDRATLVCAGDVDRAALVTMLDEAFGTWKAPPTPPAPPLVPPPPAGPWPRVVLVDRPEAPQSVIAVLRPGLAASSPDLPALERVNDAIGGSFTSRLNQDLREQRGYTYGASSRFSVSRGPGQVVAWASVVTDKTGDALGAMLGDLHQFSSGGLTDDEIARTRSQARASRVDTYESVEGIAGRLANDASLGRGADYEARASLACDEAQRPQLDALAKRFYAPEGAILVVVGPRAQVRPMLDTLGLPAPEMRDAEGNILR
ncbi:MAG TPA: pitrilysin family protein [Polyangiaceae bacterium]|jgi:predicted Zn-dependent peptidase